MMTNKQYNMIKRLVPECPDCANSPCECITNEDRREWAERALAVYPYGDDRESAPVDLITNLMHLMGSESFADAVRIATGHYEVEK